MSRGDRSLQRLLARMVLHPLRLLPAPGEVPRDAFTPEYLYLVQQGKRLSLVRTLHNFRLRTLPLWPLLLLIAVVKLTDLVLANALIRSLINEHDLRQRLGPPSRGGD